MKLFTALLVLTSATFASAFTVQADCKKCEAIIHETCTKQCGTSVDRTVEDAFCMGGCHMATHNNHDSVHDHNGGTGICNGCVIPSMVQGEYDLDKLFGPGAKGGAKGGAQTPAAAMPAPGTPLGAATGHGHDAAPKQKEKAKPMTIVN
ncbi:hypothetical protein BT63DRAFT_455508 [Microthyrium microscopicum]|uniref:Uncharacterized protein n=1 Tax=Microthyrium microscopicum TaxID=703497 RepID=A0A6A6UDJ7_9PEZI|nr:hypothetical protein BT63DRAFT_455508 [Microthyrium microscopicum]